jgi:hypothetical protein
MSETIRSPSSPTLQNETEIRHPGAAGDVADYEYNWTIYAALSGVVGAFIVAVTFLAIDLLSGRPPLWTPTALGSALFLGEPLSPDVNFSAMLGIPIVFAYTLMHGVVFLGFGALAASGRLTHERSKHFTWGPAVGTALLLFLGLEITFLALGWIVGPGLDLAAWLGLGWIAFANALAAIGMTLTIGWAARRLAKRSS